MKSSSGGPSSASSALCFCAHYNSSRTCKLSGRGEASRVSATRSSSVRMPVRGSRRAFEANESYHGMETHNPHRPSQHKAVEGARQQHLNVAEHRSQNGPAPLAPGPTRARGGPRSWRPARCPTGLQKKKTRIQRVEQACHRKTWNKQTRRETTGSNSKRDETAPRNRSSQAARADIKRATKKSQYTQHLSCALTFVRRPAHLAHLIRVAVQRVHGGQAAQGRDHER